MRKPYPAKRLSSTNFAWSFLEYFDSHVGHYLSHSDIFNAKFDSLLNWFYFELAKHNHIN